VDNQHQPVMTITIPLFPATLLSPAELASLLKTPVLPRSLSKTYPTRDRNHRLLAGLQGNSLYTSPLLILVLKR